MKISNIATLTSSQLLDYSKEVHRDRKIYTPNAYGLITKSIDERRRQINAGSDKANECRFDKMVKRFKI